jgi:hypothetical protein
MKTRIQLNLIKLSDPRVIRVLLLGLMLAMLLLGHGSIAHADSCPAGSNGGCSGG